MINQFKLNFLLANIANTKNKPQEVESILLTAKSKIQDNIDKEIAIAEKLVKVYITNNQPEKSLMLAEDMINRYPNDNLAISFLAKNQLFTNKRSEAIRTLVKLTDRDKKDIDHRLILASVLSDQSENKKQDSSYSTK